VRKLETSKDTDFNGKSLRARIKLNTPLYQNRTMAGSAYVDVFDYQVIEMTASHLTGKRKR
jgi:hypothetical protein